MSTDPKSYCEGLSPRERILYDLLLADVASALAGDQEHATRVVENAWKSADQVIPATPPLNELHAAIINLPCEPDSQNHAERSAFKRGHKQARHAAAELVTQIKY
jgi:hypothetical protein